jgi:hypothetical protein
MTLVNRGAPLCTIQRSKLKFDELLSNLAFQFNLRRYILGQGASPMKLCLYIAAATFAYLHQTAGPYTRPLLSST